MLKKIKMSGRFSLLLYFTLWFLIVSQIVRIIFFIWQFGKVSFNIFTVKGILFTELLIDIGTISFIVLVAVALKSIFHNNLSDTETRNARSLESMILCIPPTPEHYIQ